jgi:hypothetical protein
LVDSKQTSPVGAMSFKGSPPHLLMNDGVPFTSTSGTTTPLSKSGEFLPLPVLKKFRVIVSSILSGATSPGAHDDGKQTENSHTRWVTFNQNYEVIDQGETFSSLKKSITQEDILYILLKRDVYVYLVRWQGSRAPTRLKASFSSTDHDVKQFFKVCVSPEITII